jgi:hypothetical protein
LCAVRNDKCVVGAHALVGCTTGVCVVRARTHTSPLLPSRRGCKAQVSGKTGTVTLSDMRLRSLLRHTGTLGCYERNGTRTIQGMVGVPGRSAVAIAPRAMGRAKNRQDHDEQQHGALSTSPQVQRRGSCKLLGEMFFSDSVRDWWSTGAARRRHACGCGVLVQSKTWQVRRWIAFKPLSALEGEHPPPEHGP